MDYYNTIFKPPVGVEPTTYGLRYRCSAIELGRHKRVRRIGLLSYPCPPKATGIVAGPPKCPFRAFGGGKFEKRVAGIGPASRPREGRIVPLYYTRIQEFFK